MAEIDSLSLCIDGHLTLQKPKDSLLDSSIYCNDKSLSKDFVERIYSEDPLVRLSWDVSTLTSFKFGADKVAERLKIAQPTRLDYKAEEILKIFSRERRRYLSSHHTTIREALQGQQRVSAKSILVDLFVILPSYSYTINDMAEMGVKNTFWSSTFDTEEFVLRDCLRENYILEALRTDYLTGSLRTRIPRSMKEVLLDFNPNSQNPTHHSAAEHKFATAADATDVAESEGRHNAAWEDEFYIAALLSAGYRWTVFMSVSQKEALKQNFFDLPTNLRFLNDWSDRVYFREDGQGFKPKDIIDFYKRAKKPWNLPLLSVSQPKFRVSTL